MPQVQNTRSVPRQLLYSYAYKRFGGVADVSVDFTGGPWSIPQTQTVNSYRSGSWQTDHGESTDYESLTGEQLRSEVNLEGQSGMRLDDTGHEFWTTKSGFELIPGVVATNTTNQGVFGTVQYRYSGAVLPTSISGYWYPSIPPVSSTNYRNLYGNRAFVDLMPQKSPVNLLVSLAELYKDGLPSYEALRSTHNSFREKLADSHLETQFALRPLASDVKGLASIAARASDLIRQFHRDAGRSVRRRAVIDDVTTWDRGEVQNADLAFGPANDPSGNGISYRVIDPGNSLGTLEWIDSSHRVTRFSGAFAYHLDRFGLSVAAMADDVESLLGLNITPEVFWELTPWSWLFDWFANFGNLISALSATWSDSMILRYGYLMVHQKTTRTLFRKDGVRDYDGNVLPLIWETFSERKERVRATPYGFGFDLGSLTAMQGSILAALGISKGAKVLG